MAILGLSLTPIHQIISELDRMFEKRQNVEKIIFGISLMPPTPIHQIISELVQIFEEKKGTKTKRLTDNT